MIWYTDVDNEIVDNNSTDEKELIDEINSAIDNAKQLSNLECDNLADNSLENLNKEQLSIFLIKNYFEWWPKTYSQCLATWNFLNFSMKSALQLLYESDSAKFDDNWDPTSDGSGKTINDLIKTRWGIDLDNDSMLIKILQRKVGAHPDWKPGPQTIALVISALGWDVSNIYQWVNDLYENNENFRMQNIAEFDIWGVKYKYDKNLFTIWNEGNDVKITYNGEVKKVDISKNLPECDWFTFSNDWIKKSNVSGNEKPEVVNESSDSIESIMDSMRKSDLHIQNLEGEYIINIGKYSNGRIYLAVWGMSVDMDRNDVLTNWKFDHSKWDALLVDKKNILRNMVLSEKLASIIRWKRYSFEDLFDDKTWLNEWEKLKMYFWEFKDSLLKVSVSRNEVKALWQKILFRLDDKWSDKEYHRDLPIDDPNLIANENWTFNVDKFKDFLKKTILEKTFPEFKKEKWIS